MRRFIIPNHLQLKEKLLTVGMDMILQSEGKNIGIIKQKLLTIGKRFELEDLEGRVVASARKKIIALIKQYQIYDDQDSLLGTLNHEILKSAASPYDKYTIKDKVGNSIGQSNEITLIRTSVSIYNNNGKIADMCKSINPIKDIWNVNFYGDFDKRLLIFIPSFISQQKDEDKSYAKDK